MTKEYGNCEFLSLKMVKVDIEQYQWRFRSFIQKAFTFSQIGLNYSNAKTICNLVDVDRDILYFAVTNNILRIFRC